MRENKSNAKHLLNEVKQTRINAQREREKWNNECDVKSSSSHTIVYIVVIVLLLSIFANAMFNTAIT